MDQLVQLVLIKYLTTFTFAYMRNSRENNFLFPMLDTLYFTLLITRHPSNLQSLCMMRRCNQLLGNQSKLATWTLRLSMQHLHPLFIKNTAHCFQSGKRVILFSYGSGLTATMLSLQLRDAHHPFNLSNTARVMDVAGKLKSRHEFSTEKFVETLKVMEWNIVSYKGVSDKQAQ